MNKFISAILVVIIILISIIGCTGVASAGSNGGCGDVNLDGEVSICDVTDIQKHLAKLSLLDASALANADAYKDNIVSIRDATAIQMYLVHLIDSLPKLHNATVVVENVTAKAGETVQVPVVIHNNPGINGMQLNISYDSGLTLTKAENGTALSSLNLTLPATYSNPSKFLWDGMSENETGNGVVLTLTFTVPANAKTGDKYEVSVGYPAGSIYDVDLNDVDFDTINGSVSVDNGDSTDSSEPSGTTYTVVFRDYDLTELKTEIVASGSSAFAPSVPYREGYIFSHWDTEFNNVTSDLAVTAVYTKLDKASVAVGEVVAEAGETVQVPVVIHNNSGVNGMQLNIAYDTDLVLTKAEKGTALSALNLTVPATYSNPSRFLWDGMSENETSNGVALTLTFTVPADAKTGDKFDISVEYPAGSIYDVDLNDVDFDMINGSITVNNNDSQPSVATYTVVFKDYDGKILDTQAVESGNSAVAPSTPEREGYVFSGWDTAFDNVTGDLVVTAVYTEVSDPTVMVGKATASAGETVEVPVTIYNNPGVNGMQLNIAYDSALTLTKATNGTALSSLFLTLPGSYGNPSKFLWDGMSENEAGNGVALILTFTVPGNAKSGEVYEISVSYPNGSIYDVDLNDVIFETVNGSITVS